ncbi:FHA domain-containing protein [Panacagrimonas sp.]|uniref:FHA domain-containing protein n=1 Tax=Panacagrimonas sp. TaxID=2480088 RepID=UPI003B51A127
MSERRTAAILFLDIVAATELRANFGDARTDAMLDPLLDELNLLIEQGGGEALKADGDGLLAVFDHPDRCVADAAQVAVDSQRAARAVGRKLYAGLHAGVVEFREVLGRPDVSGMAVNVAARLHKLVPGLGGYVFVAAETVPMLPPDLRRLVRPYGVRPIRGLGDIEIHTLDWDEAVTLMRTQFAPPPAATETRAALILNHMGRQLQLVAPSPPLNVGRGGLNELRIHDAEQRMSSQHLRLVCRHSGWVVQDISRNGTWVRFEIGASAPIRLLGDELKLLSNGQLCLGRPFSSDPGGRYILNFQLLKI